jgi:adenine phosphoribosyltransferase
VQSAAHALPAPVATATYQQSITRVPRTIESVALQARIVLSEWVGHPAHLNPIFRPAPQTIDLRRLSAAAFPAKVARWTAPLVDNGEGTAMVESGTNPDTLDTASLQALVRDVPDFPQAGIIFRDITPLLANGAALRSAVDALAALYDGIDSVVGIESRGFILGAPVAYALGVGMVPVRKLGRLPRATERADYALEYGTNTVEIHADALLPGERVLIVDDVLATGGTAAATAELVKRLGGEVVGIAVLIELPELGGRERLASYAVTSLLQYRLEGDGVMGDR